MYYLWCGTVLSRLRSVHETGLINESKWLYLLQMLYYLLPKLLCIFALHAI